MRAYARFRVGRFLRIIVPLGSTHRRRPAAKYWTHGSCTIRHRTQAAAARCHGRI